MAIAATVPQTCQPIQTQIDELEQRLEELENALESSSGSSRVALERQIARVDAQVAQEQTQLKACVAKNSDMPPPVGSIIRPAGQQTVYLVAGDGLHAFPDAHTLEIQYPNPSIVPVAAMAPAEFPIGDPVPQVRRFIADTGNQNLGANHWMHTVVGFEFSTGKLVGRTRTSTETWLGGFHGTVAVTLLDEDTLAVGSGRYDVHKTYDVDGTIIGQSIRYGDWSVNVDLADVPKVCSIEIFHSWAGEDFLGKLKAWEQALLPLDQLLPKVGGMATSSPAQPSTAPTKPAQNPLN